MSEGGNVVELRPGPTLRDIPGMLRSLADAVEAGEHGDVGSALVLIPREDDYPLAFGFGEQGGESHPIIVMEQAKVWFVANIVGR